MVSERLTPQHTIPNGLMALSTQGRDDTTDILQQFKIGSWCPVLRAPPRQASSSLLWFSVAAGVEGEQALASCTTLDTQCRSAWSAREDRDLSVPKLKTRCPGAFRPRAAVIPAMIECEECSNLPSPDIVAV